MHEGSAFTDSVNIESLNALHYTYLHTSFWNISFCGKPQSWLQILKYQRREHWMLINEWLQPSRLQPF